MAQNFAKFESNFYNSRVFHEKMQTVDEQQRKIINNHLSNNYNNNKFVKVTDYEIMLYRGSKKVTETTQDVFISLFHLLSSYKIYDYSDLNQFEEKRLKNQHTLEVNNKHKLYTLLGDYYYELEIPYSSFGDYNFEENSFEIDTDLFKLNSKYKLQDSQCEILTPRGYVGHYYVEPLISFSYPHLRIYFNNLDMAEKFGQSNFKIRVNIQITDQIIINSGNNFYDKDTGNFGYDKFIYEGKKSFIAKGKTQEFNSISEESKVLSYILYLEEQIQSSPMPEYAEALLDGAGAKIVYNRIFPHYVKCKISSLEIYSDLIGRYFWKPNDWYSNFVIHD